MTARPAATQEPGRTNSRHADASLAQAATTAQAQHKEQIMDTFDTTDDRQRGYEAARAGIVGYRHDRYWIDTPGCAELVRPDVVKGIVAYYQDADAADLRDTGPTLAEWQLARDEQEAAREAAELYEWASGR